MTREGKLGQADAEIHAGHARRTMAPALQPPEEVVASLQAEGCYERRGANRA